MSKIELKSRHGLRLEITKLEHGTNKNGSPVVFANSITYFDPLQHILLLADINSLESVDMVRNVAYYGEGLGGISLVVADGFSFDNLIADLQQCLDDEEELNHLLTNAIKSIGDAKK